MTNEQAVAAATEGFYAALNIVFTGDSLAMKDVWAHDEDVTYMGPDGLYLIGWGEIVQMWEGVAALKLGGHIVPQQLHSVVGSDMAVITCIESGENVSGGKTETVGIRSSTVFHKRDSMWKVVGHQADLLGFLP